MHRPLTHRSQPKTIVSNKPLYEEKNDVAAAHGTCRRQHDGPTGSDAHPGRQGAAHGQTGERDDLLHPSQREAQGTGRLLHPAQRGSHPGKRRPAGAGPLPGTHGIQRHEEPAGQAADRISGDRGREVRLQPQCRNGLGPDDLPDQGRADDPRRDHRLGPADSARLVALHCTGGRRDRRGTRRDLRRTAHARRCLMALDDDDAESAGQGFEV